MGSLVNQALIPLFPCKFPAIPHILSLPMVTRALTNGPEKLAKIFIFFDETWIINKHGEFMSGFGIIEYVLLGFISMNVFIVAGCIVQKGFGMAIASVRED